MLLIAGKGHETGQIVGNQMLPFSDHEAVAAALRGKAGMSNEPLWTVDAMAQAMRAERARRAAGVDLRHLDRQPHASAAARRSSRSQGDNRDGHDSSPAALAKPAPGLRWSPTDKRDAFPNDAPLLVVPDVLEGLRDLARAARARSQAKVIGVTGSVGKTGTKEALRLALAAVGRDACLGRLLQQSLGRAAVARALPASARFAVFEMGMNHAGEIEPLSRLVRPHVAIITTIAPVHLEYLRLDRGDRRRQGGDLPRASSPAARR